MLLLVFSVLVAVVVAGDRQLVVVDTDAGADDVLALLLLLGDPGLKVLGVSCVRGNVPAPQAARNALKTLHLAGRLDVPVFSGSDFGLVETVPSDHFYGVDGLMNASFPEPPDASATLQAEHAASYLARVVREHPGKIQFLALGPLTNFALALHLNPDFLRQAQSVVILGGSITGRGNIAPGLEFNFYADAAAAHVVLEFASLTDSQVTVVPLETVIKNDLTYKWRWGAVSEVNSSLVLLMDAVERRVQTQHALTLYHPPDVFAAGVLMSPEFVVLSQDYYALVESEGRHLRGYLLVDSDDMRKQPPNVRLVLEVNVDVLKNKTIENLASFKSN